MLRKLLGAIGIGSAKPGAAAAAPPSPASALYDLLFCDDLEPFRPRAGAELVDWQAALFADPPDHSRVAAIANDQARESRVRAIAYAWLRAHGHPTPRGVVLGVVIEVPMEQGLDVLAAYADGTVRYINQTGRMAIVEPGALPEAEQQAKRLIELSRQVVQQIGPWDKPRLPPPKPPEVRLTFIVSDGLYFGQGPFEHMHADARSGPLLQQGAQLLTTVVDKALA